MIEENHVSLQDKRIIIGNPMSGKSQSNSTNRVVNAAAKIAFRDVRAPKVVRQGLVTKSATGSSKSK